MKRFGLPLIFILVLIAPLVLQRTINASNSKPLTPAPVDALQLVILSPQVEGIRREFANAFSAWHREKYGQPVTIDYRSYGTGDIVGFLRTSKESFKQLGSYGGVDLVWGGGDVFFNLMKHEGFLDAASVPPEVLKLAFPRRDLGGLPIVDPDNPPRWFGTALASFGIGFNRDGVKYLGVREPSTWRDLADPRWCGWLIMADPTRSSSAVASYMTIVERAMQDAKDAGRSEDEGWANGMGLLRQIAANARTFTDGASSMPGWLSSGDAGAAMMIDFYALAQIDAVGSARMGYVQPINATAISPDPIALVPGAPHRMVAEHFIEFVLSQSGQKLWYEKPGELNGPKSTALYRLPIRADLYQSDPSLSAKANPFAAASGFNTSPARRKTFGVLADLIQVSCITPLDELRETRRAISAAGRKDLDNRLGRFPFDQKEALARAAKLDAVKTSPARRLALIRQWTAEFDEEYRQLRDEAHKGN